MLEDEFAKWKPGEPLGSWTYVDRLDFKWLRENRNSIVVCDVDKNMGVCLCDRTWVEQQSSYHIFAVCKTLSPEEWKTSVDKAICEARRTLNYGVRHSLISSAEVRWLVQRFSVPEAGLFRLLPKLHKTPTSSRLVFTAGKGWNRCLVSAQAASAFSK